jgi:DNA-binding transcriptional ArsR family regulator
MNEQIRAIAELDRVIHEPGRMMIIALLAAVEECEFLFLLRETELNKGNLSSHLTKLEEAGYVEVRKTFRGKVPQTLLRLTASGRAAFDAYRSRLNVAFLEHVQDLAGTGQRPASAAKPKLKRQKLPSSKLPALPRLIPRPVGS